MGAACTRDPIQAGWNMMERGQVRHRCNEQIELDQLDKGGAYYEDII